MIIPSLRGCRRIREPSGLCGTEPRRVTLGDRGEGLAHVGSRLPAYEDGVQRATHQAVGNAVDRDHTSLVHLSRIGAADLDAPVGVGGECACVARAALRPASLSSNAQHQARTEH